MTLVQCKDYLRENFPYLVLRQILVFLLSLFDKLGDVSAFAVFHNDVNFGVFLVNNSVVVPDDVLMLEIPKDVDLRD